MAAAPLTSNTNNQNKPGPAADATKKASAGAGDAAQSSSSGGATSDEINNIENRPNNYSTNGERKKLPRKKWLPIDIDVRTSRGGGGGGARRERLPSRGASAGGGGGGISRPRISRGSAAPSNDYQTLESTWGSGPSADRRPFKGGGRGGGRSTSAASGGVVAPSLSSPTMNGMNSGSTYPRRNPRRSPGPNVSVGVPRPGGEGGTHPKKGADPSHRVNGADLKNGAPIFYAVNSLSYKEMIRIQM